MTRLLVRRVAEGVAGGLAVGLVLFLWGVYDDNHTPRHQGEK